MPTVRQSIEAQKKRAARALGASYAPNQTEAFLLDVLVEEHARSNRLLSPWLELSELGIEWLFSLNSALEDVNPKPRDSDLATWALSGYLCAHVTAAHRLCQAGLGTSAAVLVRVIVETVRLGVILAGNEALAREWVEAGRAEMDGDSGRTRGLWRKLTGRGASQLFRSALPELQGGDLDAVVDWFARDLSLYSGVVHPSFHSAVIASRPLDFSEKRRRLAVVGRVSLVDWQSLNRVVHALWLYVMVIGRRIIDRSPQDPLIPIDLDNAMHCNIVISGLAFQSSFMRYRNATAPKRLRNCGGRSPNPSLQRTPPG